jgi:hypothetical protein
MNILVSYLNRSTGEKSRYPAVKSYSVNPPFFEMIQYATLNLPEIHVLIPLSNIQAIHIFEGENGTD